MKLETTLEERPGFLHALPLMDLFALAAMFLYLGPLFLSQGGVTVDLPSSQFQMQRYRESIVVTVGHGIPEPRIHLGRQAVTLTELSEKLAQLREDEVMGRAIVLLKSDAGMTVGAERQVSELIMDAGFKLALVGKNELRKIEAEESE